MGIHPVRSFLLVFSPDIRFETKMKVLSQNRTSIRKPGFSLHLRVYRERRHNTPRDVAARTAEAVPQQVFASQ
jgi:hypothetical protein